LTISCAASEPSALIVKFYEKIDDKRGGLEELVFNFGRWILCASARAKRPECRSAGIMRRFPNSLFARFALVQFLGGAILSLLLQIAFEYRFLKLTDIPMWDSPHSVWSLESGVLGVSAVACGSMLFLAWVLRETIAPQMNALTRAAEKVRSTGFGMEVPSPRYAPDEIRRLTDTFNDMVAEVAAHRATLEHRVQERMSDLENANQKLRDHIADRWRIEQNLEERTSFLNALVENNPLAVVAFNSEGLIQLCNPAFEHLFQYPQKDILGARLDQLISDDRTRSESQEMVHRAIAGEAIHLTTQRKRRDGSTVYVEFYGVPLIAHGVRLGGLALYQDITERKLLESQLVQAQKLESIGHLAAGIAHEINTPIQYVGDNTSFLKESFENLVKIFDCQKKLLCAVKELGVVPTLVADAESTADEIDVDYLWKEIPRAIEQSAEGVKRVATIVRAMKEFSHPSGDQMKEVDINHAIESTLTVSRNEWKYSAEMSTDFDPALPLVRCLADEFNQVILNLVVNAAHTIGDVQKRNGGNKGRITVKTRRDGEWAEIRVTDTGAGIPEEIHSKIFTPFFTTKEVGKGTGQGLAIAHSVVVKKHGGNISFETVEGQGTTFIVRIPIKGKPESN
jgi:PAS domain S-box-containing protein